MSTKKETLLHNVVFTTKHQYLPRITLTILEGIAKKFKDEYGGYMEFEMENLENFLTIKIRYDIGQPGRFNDPKPLNIRIIPYGDTMSEDLDFMKTPSGFVDYINKFWANKKWLCVIKYETPITRNTKNIGETTKVVYRNTKSNVVSKPVYIDNKTTAKYVLTKVKPSIRTSRKAGATKKTTVDSLNGRKTSSPKSPFSKMVGVRPTKKCNFKKLI